MTTTTIVVAPRETHSHTLGVVCRLVDVTPSPVRLVVVDGGSPRWVHRRLQRLARELDFTLIRHDALLGPGEARNLALPHVNSELVALVDNDTEVAAGWLKSLERCLRETDSAIVMPVVLERGPGRTRVHYAGGDCRIELEDGRRRLVDFNPYIGKDLDVLDSLPHEPTENIELHCALARTDLLKGIGAFDESLLGVRDDADLALRYQEHGYHAWIDASTTVIYPYPKLIRFGDFTFFRTRWSDAWTEPGFVHFNLKWRIDDRGVDDVFRRGHMERRVGFARWPRPPEGWRLRAWRWHRRVARAIDRVATPVCVWRAARRRAAAPAARVVHHASWDHE